MNSCPFVSIRGSKPPTAFHPQPLPRCTNSRLFVSIRGSKRPAAKPLQDRSRAGKPDLHKFVSIRVHSWFKTTHCVSPAATARAARIRGYSCSFVVQNHPPRSPFRTDLGLESPTYINSCPFVFIRGSKPPPAFHPQPQPALHEFVSIRVHLWFKTTRREAPSGQIAVWKARAT
jgi:hypothetical protein